MEFGTRDAFCWYNLFTETVWITEAASDVASILEARTFDRYFCSTSHWSHKRSTFNEWCLVIMEHVLIICTVLFIESDFNLDISEISHWW